MGEGAARVLSRAGRRSAGLGSDGGARTHTHAVGVRAHGAVRVPQTKRGGVGDGAICSVVVHMRLFDGAKVVFFPLQSGTRWRSCLTGKVHLFVDVCALAELVPFGCASGRTEWRGVGWWWLG